MTSIEQNNIPLPAFVREIVQHQSPIPTNGSGSQTTAARISILLTAPIFSPKPSSPPPRRQPLSISPIPPIRSSPADDPLFQLRLRRLPTLALGSVVVPSYMSHTPGDNPLARAAHSTSAPHTAGRSEPSPPHPQHGPPSPPRHSPLHPASMPNDMGSVNADTRPDAASGADRPPPTQRSMGGMKWGEPLMLWGEGALSQASLASVSFCTRLDGEAWWAARLLMS